MHAPSFWFTPEPTPLARLLQPLGWLYGRLATLNGTLHANRAYYAGVPVISLGNLTVGGAGKTPLVQALASHFANHGQNVAIISRGYGGSAKITRWPTKVDPATHTAQQVGDEPLMLARSFPHLPVQVWVCRNRPLAVRRAEQAGATLILLDDGFQRRDVGRQVDLLVIDGRNGLTSAFGNGLCFPAGPLREPLTNCTRATFAIVMNEPTPTPPAQPLLPYYGLPAYRLFSRLLAVDSGRFPKGPLIAFAGLADPQKFFNSLTAAGLQPILTVPFPDHHTYPPRDLKYLKELSKIHNATLITTEKDAVKLPANFAHALPLEIYGADTPSILAEIQASLR